MHLIFDICVCMFVFIISYQSIFIHKFQINVCFKFKIASNRSQKKENSREKQLVFLIIKQMIIKQSLIITKLKLEGIHWISIEGFARVDSLI